MISLRLKARKSARTRFRGTGAETLRVMTQAPHYNRWIADKLTPWAGQRVLEVGSGLGTMTQFFVDREYVLATDRRADYLTALRSRFAGLPNVDVDVGYLELPAENNELAERQIDTVLMINVLEHIEDDVGAVNTVKSILVPGGRLLLLVPALPTLHGSLDRALGHYRRYRKRDLRSLAAGAGLVVEHLAYFNFVGLFGWWFNSRISRRRLIPEGQARWFDLCVPLLRRLETFFAPPVGLSLVMVARKPAEAHRLEPARPSMGRRAEARTPVPGGR